MSVQVGLLVLAVAAGVYLWLARAGNISGDQARRLVGEGARLVDVRTPEEFADGHLPGAINIPVQDLERRIDELGPKERPIVLYCRSGMRSGRAARQLSSAGFVAVHNLGSIGRW